MAMVATDSQNYTDIAAAIRDRNGEETLYKPGEMAAAIENIPSVSELIDQTIVGPIYSEAKSIRSSIFDYCSKLTEVNFPNATSIGTYSFRGCNKLTTLNFPEVTKLGGYAFQSCGNVTSVYMPKLAAVGTADFYGMSAVATLDFPSVTSIGSSCFNNCGKLTALILRSETMVTLGSTGSFSGTPIANGTGYIYVPAALLDTYKAATNWSTFADQFRAIEDYPDITGG